jgi:hypothetical protein
MNKKNVLLVLLAFVLNYPVYLGIKDINYANQTKTYCGTVKDIETQLKAVKHGTRTDYYLLVEFDSIGTRLIDVTPETFYIHGKEGNRVCFELRNQFVKKTNTSGLLAVGFAFGVAIGLIYDIILIFLVINMILSVDDSEKPKNRKTNWSD